MVRRTKEGPIVYTVTPCHRQINREMLLMNTRTKDDLSALIDSGCARGPVWFFSWDADEFETMCSPRLICG
jgi:hypothetical protein